MLLEINANFMDLSSVGFGERGLGYRRQSSARLFIENKSQLMSFDFDAANSLANMKRRHDKVAILIYGGSRWF